MENMPPKLDPQSSTDRLELLAPHSLVERVDEWRRQQPDIPNRSEALRRLVGMGLAAGKQPPD